MNVFRAVAFAIALLVFMTSASGCGPLGGLLFYKGAPPPPVQGAPPPPNQAPALFPGAAP